MGSWRWLMPGLRLKRWVLVLCLGIVFLVIGAIFLGLALFQGTNPTLSETGPLAMFNFYTMGGTLVGSGVVCVFTGVYRLIRTTEKLLRKGEKRGIAELAYDLAKREVGPRLVCIGGGHGLSTLLAGLRHHEADITAVVSMADDGGSSGRLRKDFDMLPPGDIRNCLVALADAGPVMQELMQYRFQEGEFAGHSFGNLFIMVLTHIRDDFGQAILESNRILSVRGRVLPATLDRVSLVASHADGTKSTGQRVIAQCGKPIEQLELKPTSGSAPQDVLEAIRAADMIVLGPGSLYTSVLPPLLEEDIQAEICRARAPTVYVVNTMSQPGETDGFAVQHYLEALQKHAPQIKLDAVLVNAYRPSPKKLAALAAEQVELTGYDRRELAQLDTRVFLRDVISMETPARHDPEKLAKAVLEIHAQLQPR